MGRQVVGLHGEEDDPQGLALTGGAGSVMLPPESIHAGAAARCVGPAPRFQHIPGDRLHQCVVEGGDVGVLPIHLHRRRGTRARPPGKSKTPFGPLPTSEPGCVRAVLTPKSQEVLCLIHIVEPRRRSSLAAVSISGVNQAPPIVFDQSCAISCCNPRNCMTSHCNCVCCSV